MMSYYFLPLFYYFFNLSIKQGLCKSKIRKKNIHALAKLNECNCDRKTPVAQAIKHFGVQEFSLTNEHTLYKAVKVKQS